MKVRVKEGMSGFIYGILRLSNGLKGPDEFTLKPLAHSTQRDKRDEPVVISVEKQFNPKWMENLKSPKQAKAEA